MENVFHQEIHRLTVSAPRTPLITYLVFFGVCDVLMAGAFVVILVLAGLLLSPQLDLGLVSVIILELLMVVNALLLFFVVIILSSFVLFTVRRLFSRQPTLLVTPQGIDLRDVSMVGSLFLSWGEVAAISVIIAGQSLSGPIHHLCLTPKDPVQFLSRFPLVRRLLVHFGSAATGALIPLPQWVLSEPVEAILTQIQELFQGEIRRYEVRLVHPSSEKEHG